MTGQGQNRDVILRVEDLRTHFFTAKGLVKAVDGVSFSLARGEILGLVGESGAGKSVLGFSLLGLIDPPGRIVDGRVLFDGQDLRTLPGPEMEKIRGDRIAMIFQDPLTSLDPVFSIGYQMAETLRAHGRTGGADLEDRSAELLRRVNIPSPRERLRDYPHQFSGGMRQRVGIAMGVSGDPELIIADEPTTALDVTTQAQIMTLLHRLVRNKGAAMILITHDIALVGQICDSIGVMYAGRLVELGPKEGIINRPLHPYTRGLIRSIPGRREHKGRLFQIPGMMPDLSDLPAGCAFAPRCDLADEACRTRPVLRQAEPGRLIACHRGKPASGGKTDGR